MSDIAAQELIASYRSAYQTATGEPLPSTIRYVGGWFVGTRDGYPSRRWRQSKFEWMRDTLLKHAATNAASAPSPALSHEEAGR
jgi:hypothetical protein